MRWLAAAVALTGCQTSYLVGRGDAALERGDPQQALANYLAALERPISPGTKDDVEAKRNEAASAFAASEITAARSEARSAARDRLWALAVTNMFGAGAARKAVLDALSALDAEEWSKVDALVDSGRLVAARVVARSLAAPFDVGSEPAKRELEIADRARAHHLRLAKGEDASAYFHAMIASALGAAVEGIERRRATVDRLSAVPWKVELRGPCPALAERLTGRCEGAVRLVIDRCVAEEKTWIETETQTYRARVPVPEIIEEPHWIEDPCPEGQCLRYDELGVCLERAAGAPCEPARRLEVRHVPSITHRDEARSIEVDVHRRRVILEAEGVVEISGVETAFSIVRSTDDQAYWQPERSQTFSYPDLAGAADSVVAELDGKARASVAASLARNAAGDESAHVLAVHMSRSVPIEAATYFRDRYELTEEQVLSILGFGRPLVESPAPPAPRAIVAAEREPTLDAFELEAVASEEDVPGLGKLTRAGIDLAAAVGMSPLDTAKLSTGLGARFRLTRLHLGMSGTSSLLGGDVGGFGVSMTGVAFDADEQGVLFSWGLAYEQQKSDAGELYRSFSLPIMLRIAIVSFLWAGIRFDPNLLFAKTIFDDEATDPHFWSPVSVWVTVDLEYVFARVSVAHFLGAGLDEPVQVEGAIGVRL
jgi:hypothetical protein